LLAGMATMNTGPGLTEPLEIPDVLLPGLVLGQARSAGAKPALIEADSGREISYAGLADAVDGAAGWLADAGIQPGDVVALCAQNSIEFVIAWYAASSAGAIISAVNPALPAEELAAYLARTSTRWLITTESLFTGKLGAVAGQVPGLAGNFVFGTGPGFPAARRFDALGLGTRQAHGREDARSPGDVALLVASSGTTGRPKSVVLTHRSLVANLCQLARSHRVTERDVTIALVPMFHVYGLQVSLNWPLMCGATIVILPRFDLGALLRAVQDHRVTWMQVAPPVAVQLAKSELVDAFDLSSLRLITSAAAPLSADVGRERERLPAVRQLVSSGMAWGRSWLTSLEPLSRT
jgi:acyl-CoA synthetase (AMP-forming)/AMP-acid ligase II